MTIQQAVITPILATILILTFARVAVRYMAARRERIFAAHADKDKQYVAERYLLPAGVSERQLGELDSLWNLVAPSHQKAIDAQSRYYSAVISAGAYVFIGFFATAVSTT